MNIIPSITQQELFATLRAFVLTLVDVEVVRGQDNRVPMPTGEFVALSPLFTGQLSTPVIKSLAETQTVQQSTQFNVQIDCYGALAGDRARVISAMLWTPIAVDAMTPNLTPLYGTDPKQTPLVNGEDQYEERWTFDAVMQYNPVITIAQQTASALAITLDNVDVNHKP